MSDISDLASPVSARSEIPPFFGVDAAKLGITPSIPKGAEAKPDDISDIATQISKPEKTLREKYKDELRAASNGFGEPGRPKSYKDGSYMPDLGTRYQNLFADPFGIGDEVRGAGGYLRGLVTSGGDTKAAKKAYEEELERARAEEEYTRENLGRVGRFGTDVLSALGTAGPGKAIAAVKNAPNFLARSAQTAKVAAPYGATSGFLHGEGGFENRIEDAGWGGLTAAVLGPAISEVGIPGLSALYRAGKSAPNALADWKRVVPFTRENIDLRLLQKLREQNMTPADARAQMQAELDATRFGDTQLNPQTTLADSGPAMQKLAYSAKATPGQASTEAENFLNARAKGSDKVEGYTGPEIPSQYERVSDYTRRSLKVTRDNAARTEDRLTAGQKTDSDAAYKAFRENPVTIPVEDILQAHAHDVAENLTTGSKLFGEIDKAYAPFVDEAHSVGGVQGPSRTQEARYNLAQMQLEDRMAKATAAGDAQKAAELAKLKDGLTDQYKALTKDANLTAPTSELSPAKFDNAKKQLDGMIAAAKADPEGGYKASLLTDLKNRLMKRADEVTTVKGPNGDVSLYAEARNAYRTPQGELDALEAGRKFKTEDLDRIKQNYSALSTPEKRAYRGGAASKIVQDLGEKPTGSNVAGYFNNPNMETRMNALAGPKSAAQHADIMAIENRMAETRGKVNFGSRTAENLEANIDFKLASRLGRQLKEGRVLGAAGDLIASTVQHIYKYNAVDAKLLARDLFATDPAQRAATLTRLEARYGRQQTQQAVRTALQLAHRTASRQWMANALTSATDHEPPKNSLAQERLR